MGHRRIGYMGFFEESLTEEMSQNAMEDASEKAFEIGKRLEGMLRKVEHLDVT